MAKIRVIIRVRVRVRREVFYNVRVRVRVRVRLVLTPLWLFAQLWRGVPLRSALRPVARELFKV